jgi:UDP-glucose 4-epimerase
MTWGSRSALVTGATGFIGRRLCVRLQQAGWRVTALARREVPGPWDHFVVHDLGQGALTLPRDSYEVVYHLAARTHAFDSSKAAERCYEAVNIGGMQQLLGALHGRARVIFASSVKAAGEETPFEGIDEKDPSMPVTPYGRTKLAAEEWLWQSRFGGQATVLRLPMIYGIGQKGNFSDFIRGVRSGLMPPLPAVENRRSLLHVDDAVDALLAAYNTAGAEGRFYYIADPCAYSTAQMYEAIRLALRRPVPRWQVPIWLFKAVAIGGDIVTKSTGLPVPWDGERYRKLFGSAYYRVGASHRDLNFVASRSLTGEISHMVNSDSDI